MSTPRSSTPDEEVVPVVGLHRAARHLIIAFDDLYARYNGSWGPPVRILNEVEALRKLVFVEGDAHYKTPWKWRDD